MNPARILVVDDNTADVGLLRLALDRQREEYLLEVLETAEEALRFVEDHLARPQPCVILLDLHLPKYDGLAILQAIKQAPSLDHVHVMVLSGMASPSERVRIATMGALYRQKPFDLNEYVELGAEILALCADETAKAA